MPAFSTATILGIIGAATAAGSATYAGISAENQRLEAKKLRDEQEVSQIKLAGEADTKMKQEDAQAAAQRTRSQARSRQRLAAASAQGRAGTILTSPLGVTGGQAGYQPKTLLGS